MINLKFFIDFDGTITKTDVVDKILERFAAPEWKAIEKEWISEKIGSRECLSRQLRLVRATKEEFYDFLKTVEVDSGFVDFIACLDEWSIPAFVVSDGFDLVIREVLKRAFNGRPKLLSGLKVFCNNLEWTQDGFKVVFPENGLCEHGCASCKPHAIEKLVDKEDKIIFIGDGWSDRFAAEISDLVFAKNKLLSFCEQEKINSLSYQSFKDVQDWLERYLSTGNIEMTSKQLQWNKPAASSAGHKPPLRLLD